MKVMRNLPNLKQDLCPEGKFFFLNVRMLKYEYLVSLVTGENETGEEIKMRISAI
jgi:hypothetical protein